MSTAVSGERAPWLGLFHDTLIVTRRNAKATLKCSCALRRYEEIIFSHDRLVA